MKYILTGILSLALTLSIAAAAPKHHGNGSGPHGQCPEMMKAMDSADYATWKTAMEKHNPQAPILKKITDANFARLIEMHSLMKKAHDIRTELGLEMGDCGCDKKMGDCPKCKGKKGKKCPHCNH